MIETQASVAQWVHEMFPTSSDLEYRVLMMIKEVIEAGLACGVSPESIKKCADWACGKVVERDDLKHAREEVGDILSTLYAFADLLKCDAHAELDRKMAFNRTRPKSYYDAKTSLKRDALKV
jgi:NTP pyrophosphatase (non-canonical NTP hydrolase)